MKSRFFTFCVLINIFAGFAFTQRMSPPPAVVRSAEPITELPPPLPRRTSRTILPARKKPNSEQKKILQPVQADLNKYAQFLKQPKTGIFRLLPDPDCEADNNIIRADQKCLNAIPESSFYSFREKEHTAKYLSDIRLSKDYLISDGTLSQSFLVVLGDTKLEDISLETDGLDYMQNFSAIAESVEAQKQFVQFARGVKSEDFVYRKVFRAAENMTYALRVIAFRGSLYQTFRGFRYDILDGDKRIDLTIAFRVIRKNDDGSLTLLWKELDRRDAPKFKFRKRKQGEK